MNGLTILALIGLALLVFFIGWVIYGMRDK